MRPFLYVCVQRIKMMTTRKVNEYNNAYKWGGGGGRELKTQNFNTQALRF